MMNKKGFTLVELMVVIVIIGVLAAVAMPKFADAINKSKCSEAPNLLGQIATQEAVWYAENSKFLDFAVTASNAVPTANAKLLGLNTKSKTFSYKVDGLGTGSQSFSAVAALFTQLGRASSGASLAIDQDGNKTSPNNKLDEYIKTWN